MTVGHVPPAVPPPDEQLPTRHRTLSLQACPALTHVTLPHWRVVWSHPRLDPQSWSPPHAAPAAPGLWQVEEAPCAAGGQTSGDVQASPCMQAEPAPPVAVHFSVS